MLAWVHRVEGAKKTKVEFKLACKLIPFSRLSHFQKHKAHLWDPGSASSGCQFSRKYTKEILKNTKEQEGPSPVCETARFGWG